MKPLIVPPLTFAWSFSLMHMLVDTLCWNAAQFFAQSQPSQVPDKIHTFHQGSSHYNICYRYLACLLFLTSVGILIPHHHLPGYRHTAYCQRPYWPHSFPYLYYWKLHIAWKDSHKPRMTIFFIGSLQLIRKALVVTRGLLESVWECWLNASSFSPEGLSSSFMAHTYSETRKKSRD